MIYIHYINICAMYYVKVYTIYYNYNTDIHMYMN